MSTRRERLERKLDKRLEWAESRKEKASSAAKRGDLSEEKSGIPLGQPILVGHHSEKRHRRALKRANNAMRQAHEHYEMSKHHEQKAKGLERQLSNTIFSDDENAVEALEAKIARLEAERKQNNAVNQVIRRKPKNERTPAKIAALVALGLSESTAAKLFESDFCGRIGIPSYVNQNLGGRIKAARDRIATIQRQNEKRERVEASENGIIIEGGDWVSVTFAEKPDRGILSALKAAGFRWGRGSWTGQRENLPECLTAGK
jgi:hypothetical protein